MTHVHIEIFRDSEVELREKVNALYELLPEGVKVTITESSIPFPIENHPATSPSQLLSFEMQRLTENQHYRSSYVSTTSIDETDLIKILESAGFVVVQKFQHG